MQRGCSSGCISKKAYEHLDSFEGNSKFYTWIVRIAVNEALMKLRKRRGDKEVSLDEPVELGEEEVKNAKLLYGRTTPNSAILVRKCRRS